jgi:very-short-patch-repair endonuclease
MPHAEISGAKKRRVRALRRTMTSAERKLWYALRAHRFGGLGFRRQVPLGRYILDFVCHDLALVVEVDGGQHFSAPQQSRDAVRDRWLASQGYRVIRIPNNEVLRNLQGVLEYLLSVAADSPLPPCGGARSRLARTEGGETSAQKLERTPLPSLPHKGGGVCVASSVQHSGAEARGKVQP